MAFLRISMVSTLLVLVLALFLSHEKSSTFVRADDELIRRLCHNSDVPVTCNQCVKADSRSDNADSVGIATIIVDCATTQANNLQLYISTLEDYKDNPAIINAIIQNCKEWFSYAKSNLYAATLGLKDGIFDTSDQSVFTATQHLYSCQTEISQNPNITASPEIEFGFNMFNELTQIALSIIRHL